MRAPPLPPSTAARGKVTSEADQYLLLFPEPGKEGRKLPRGVEPEKERGRREAGLSLSLRVLFHAMIRTPPFSVRHVHCVVDKPSAASCMEEEGGGREEGGLVEEE